MNACGAKSRSGHQENHYKAERTEGPTSRYTWSVGNRPLAGFFLSLPRWQGDPWK